MKTRVPNLLTNINRHGILPNHLIQLLRLTNKKNLHKILNDLRFSAFWATYNVWKKRQRLNRVFWKTESDRLNDHSRQYKGQKKRKRKHKKNIFEDCKNPFHYLLLKNNMTPHGTCDCRTRMKYHTEKKTQLTSTEKKISVDKKILVSKDQMILQV